MFLSFIIIISWFNKMDVLPCWDVSVSWIVFPIHPRERLRPNI
jgi:hypothetical protein